MGYRPRNRAKRLIAKYTGSAKLVFPQGVMEASNKPVIFVNGNVTDGVVNTLGRSVEVGLTLEQAVSLHAQLGRSIEDVAHAQKITLIRQGMRFEFAGIAAE